MATKTAPKPNSTLDLNHLVSTFSALGRAAKGRPMPAVIVEFAETMPRPATPEEIATVKASDAYKVLTGDTATRSIAQALVTALMAGPRAPEANKVVDRLKSETDGVESPKPWSMLFRAVIRRLDMGDKPEQAFEQLAKDPEFRPSPALIAAAREVASLKARLGKAMTAWLNAHEDGEDRDRSEAAIAVVLKAHAKLPSKAA